MDTYLSTFRIPIEKIPEAKNWKVGGRYQLTAEVEQTGIQKERDYRSELDGPVSIKASKGSKPKYHTMAEFKVFDVSPAARAKTKALKKYAG